LLREVIGNPFRPVFLDPGACETALMIGAALRIAEQIGNQEEF